MGDARRTREKSRSLLDKLWNTVTRRKCSERTSKGSESGECVDLQTLWWPRGAACGRRRALLLECANPAFLMDEPPQAQPGCRPEGCYQLRPRPTAAPAPGGRVQETAL